MRNWCQKDGRWKDLKIGNTDLTMENYGCLITSLAILDGRTPKEILEILNRSSAFNDKGMLYSDIASKALGFSYKGKHKESPKYECVAETNHWAYLRIPQHFFVWNPDGTIVDPLDGQMKTNNYEVVSYRLFKKKSPNELPKKPVKVIEKPSLTVTIEKPPTLLQRIKAWIEKILNNLARR